MKNENITRDDLKKLHQKQIFLCARGEGLADEYAGISRSELARKLGLSSPSITALVDELIEMGLLVETGVAAVINRGRPREILKVNSECIFVPVFDMQRNGYRFVLYDICGRVAEESFIRFGSRPSGNSDAWKPTLEELCEGIVSKVKQLRGKYRVSDISLSIPGNINADGFFTSSAINLLSPVGFKEYIESKTELKAVMLNRADCFAYSERIYSKIDGDYIYLHISDGIGGGIIRNGRIYKYGNWRAGEIGHMSIDFNGKSCVCGSRGCLEKYVSTEVIVSELSELKKREIFDFHEVIALFKSGDEKTVSLISEKAELLSAAINNVFSLHPISNVIIGGEFAELGEGLLDIVLEKLSGRVSRMYKDSFSVALSRSHINDATVGAFHNYVTNVMDIDVLRNNKS